MSGHLCLKWNNHSSAFLRSISNIHIKERYCDATIACQGKYFPVHRIILSTCSDYFEEIFERMQSPHPYIVFKDIEPREMELLLNYMYQGEVNVVQEMLPSLIKAAEALRIKGLAVPDEIPPAKDSSSGRKRSNTSSENPQPKRRSEGGSRRKDSSELISTSTENEGGESSFAKGVERNDFEQPVIKEEPADSNDYTFNEPIQNISSLSSDPSESPFIDKQEHVFVDYANPADTYIKNEGTGPTDQSYQEQPPTSWADFSAGNSLDSLSVTEMSNQDNVVEWNRAQNVEINISNKNEASSSGTPLEGGGGLEEVLYPPENVTAGPNLIQCPYCNYGSCHKYNVLRHMKFKHSKDKPFKCYVCPSQFSHSPNLQRHMLTHTGEKPYQCPQCPLKFRHSTSLKLHLSRHHR